MTALVLDRWMLAMAPSNCGLLVPEAVIGRLCSSERSSSRYCGVWMAIGYCTPFCGFNQNVGATCDDPARFTTMLLVTSRSVTPAYCALVRSTSTLNAG